MDSCGHPGTEAWDSARVTHLHLPHFPGAHASSPLTGRSCLGGSLSHIPQAALGLETQGDGVLESVCRSVPWKLASFAVGWLLTMSSVLGGNPESLLPPCHTRACTHTHTRMHGSHPCRNISKHMHSHMTIHACARAHTQFTPMWEHTHTHICTYAHTCTVHTYVGAHAHT